MITIKSPREIELMRDAGKIVGDLLNLFHSLIKPGITTIELDRLAEEFIINRKAKPAFKGYVAHFKKNYPATLCTSVNESVVHEIPSNRVLLEDDIVSIDVGVVYNGYYGDGAYTFAVGEISVEKKRLITVTLAALYKGIEKAVHSNYLSDISNAIQQYVESQGLTVVREFTGHGIGTFLHEDPPIPNFGSPHKGPELKTGMTLAIEPMVNFDTHKVKILPNGWCAVTCDGKPSAHFEHTIAITDGEPQILTLPSK